jgi:hypothetical protein
MVQGLTLELRQTAARAISCFVQLKPVRFPSERGAFPQNFRCGQFWRAFFQVHPPADAATPKRKLAKASLRGEGQIL